MKYLNKKRARINLEIQLPEVRLIDADGQQAGIVSIREAQQVASQAELDLVEISPTAKPPVCKIMDYKKFVYEQRKQQAAAKKKQKKVQVKEIKFRPVTEDGDYRVKVERSKKFLDNGDRVKITLRFRGREMAHQELGLHLLQRVEADLQEYSDIEQRPKIEGRQMVMLLVPKKHSKKTVGKPAGKLDNTSDKPSDGIDNN
ncbi:MAG: translation initiation factor IF-3 [Gammaproteobacteria bacterium]|nr:translation initiation factor IF-3 [Gammaproteobacteria bacterium]